MEKKKCKRTIDVLEYLKKLLSLNQIVFLESLQGSSLKKFHAGEDSIEQASDLQLFYSISSHRPSEIGYFKMDSVISELNRTSSCKIQAIKKKITETSTEGAEKMDEFSNGSPEEESLDDKIRKTKELGLRIGKNGMGVTRSLKF